MCLMEEERRGEVLGMIRGRVVACPLPGCTLNAYKPKSLAVCKLQKARCRSSPFVNLLSGVFRLGRLFGKHVTQSHCQLVRIGL